ncbi:hypothetical protein [Cellulomonas shaoxiangyii]|uniref:Uncharacterized protein n=1 Tax=Cellulomonas shaoxiangyii TaxID=2566013 RepID=A0A4P7SK77_9CELL|nr:hypothetical protein [Cellulomonas shaoxiangyii]QCB93867.1 hypothetical protein E5225_10155 [Cellulomonas shaoxiangyii]TGY83221.1 hypothetical protein E5226_12415 [Cellulomonas shaoxiangyii]
MTGPSGPAPSPGPQQPPDGPAWWTPAAAPLPAAPGPSAPHGPGPHAPGPHASAPRTPVPFPVETPPRRRRAVAVLSVVLVAVLVAAGLVGARLWTTTREWERAAAEWEALARTHGDQLAQATAELEATTGDLAATRDQLATAQARITELADEKAQLGDTTAAQQQLADYQARVSEAAGEVATALANCIDGQEALIGYLGEADRYDAAELARFRADVERVCGAASDANASLQRELAR